jgi:hypothetical protein
MPSSQCIETKRAAMVERPERENFPLFVNTPCDDYRMSEKGAIRRKAI